MIPIVICYLLVYIIWVSANTKCSNESPLISPKYFLMEKCHRSKLGVVARANYTSINSCRRLGIEKKALAFNFSPPDAMGSDGKTLEYSCEVLKCAEVSGGLAMVNDSRYDYYSIYAKPIPHINSTCVPAIGMFYLLSKRLNYTQAEAECRDMSGVLADVTNEQRTESLAQLVAGSKLDAAYVGLRRRNTTAFYSNNGDSLECSTYRAWAPGHPRRSRKQYDCAAITSRRTWQSIPCKLFLPAICELMPGGPYRIGSIFPNHVKSTVVGCRSDFLHEAAISLPNISAERIIMTSGKTPACFHGLQQPLNTTWSACSSTAVLNFKKTLLNTTCNNGH